MALGRPTEALGQYDVRLCLQLQSNDATMAA